MKTNKRERIITKQSGTSFTRVTFLPGGFLESFNLTERKSARKKRAACHNNSALHVLYLRESIFDISYVLYETELKLETAFTGSICSRTVKTCIIRWLVALCNSKCTQILSE